MGSSHHMASSNQVMVMCSLAKGMWHHNLPYNKHLGNQWHSLAAMGSKHSSLAFHSHSLEACSSCQHNMAYHKHLANMACK